MSFFAGKFYRNRKISSHKICEDIKVVYGVFIYIVIHLTPIHLMTEVTSILGLNCKRIAKITSTPKKNSTKNGSSLQSWHFLSVFASSVVFVSFLIIFYFVFAFLFLAFFAFRFSSSYHTAEQTSNFQRKKRAACNCGSLNIQRLAFFQSKDRLKFCIVITSSSV